MNRSKPDQERIRVSTAETEEQIGSCYEAMSALRTELGLRDNFVAQIKRQQKNFGYVLLAALSRDAMVIGLAGFRPQENLMHGLHLYVDDLVTVEAWRSRGVGAVLMEAVITQARGLRCKEILLDTGQQNEAAHRFYARLGFTVRALRFSLELD